MLQVVPTSQATESKRNITRGQFLPTDHVLVKSCYHNNDSVTHSDVIEKQGLVLYWTAPEDLHEVLVIRYEMHVTFGKCIKVRNSTAPVKLQLRILALTETRNNV